MQDLSFNKPAQRAQRIEREVLMNHLGLLKEEAIAVDAHPKLKLKSQHPKWDNRHGENQTSSAGRHREVQYQNTVL